jgi:PucR C-terminal helix-turn-helix domain/GGDEF-like domain
VVSDPVPASGSLSDATLRLVVAEVAADLPELVEHVVQVIIEREAPYAARGAVLTEELRRSVQANLSGILQVLSEGRAIGDVELSVARSTGRRRAQQGVPLEAVLRGYRLGGQSLMGALLIRAGRRSAAELSAFLDVSTVALEVVDRYAQAVVEGYRQSEAESRRRDAQRRQVVFDALLDGRGSDAAVVADAASLLALPMSGPYVVVVSTFDLAVDHTLSVARDACAAYGFTAAWHTRADREIGIVALKTAPVPRLVSILGSAAAGRVGISTVFHSLRQVPDACRLAETALHTVPPDRHEAAWIEDRLVEALLAASPELARRLTQNAFGGVLALREPDRDLLLETLTAWFDSGRSPAVAAGQLYCHRNTILNRLRQVEKLTGRSLEDNRDLLAIYLALLALRLLPN